MVRICRCLTCRACCSNTTIGSHAGFRVHGKHQEEVVNDHCTIETFETLQTLEEAVTIVNPGQRFSQVSVLNLLGARYIMICHQLLSSSGCSYTGPVCTVCGVAAAVWTARKGVLHLPCVVPKPLPICC